VHPARPAPVTNPPTFQSNTFSFPPSLAMARKKIREYDSKRLLKEHLKRLAGIDLTILSAQVSASASAPPRSPISL